MRAKMPHFRKRRSNFQKARVGEVLYLGPMESCTKAQEVEKPHEQLDSRAPGKRRPVEGEREGPRSRRLTRPRSEGTEYDAVSSAPIDAGFADWWRPRPARSKPREPWRSMTSSTRSPHAGKGEGHVFET
jgi:hypothetical protein